MCRPTHRLHGVHYSAPGSVKINPYIELILAFPRTVRLSIRGAPKSISLFFFVMHAYVIMRRGEWGVHASGGTRNLPNFRYSAGDPTLGPQLSRTRGKKIPA